MRFLIKFMIFLIISLIGLAYLIIDHTLKNNIPEIENSIYLNTGIKTKLNDIDLSFRKVKINQIELTGKNYYAEIKNITITPTNYISLLGDALIGELTISSKFIKQINIDNADIFIAKPSQIKETKKNEKLFDSNTEETSIYKDLSSLIKPIEIVTINNLKINNYILRKTQIYSSNEKFHLKSNLNYKNSYINIGGTFDLINLLENEKLNADLTATGENIDLTTINSLFNYSPIKINSGKVKGETKITIKDNEWKIHLDNIVDNYSISFWDKPLNFSTFKVKGEITKETQSFVFPDKINVNSNPLDIEYITFFTSSNLDAINKIEISSNNLKYTGSFSEDFFKSKTNKEITIDFNLVNLSYLNKLGILNIPTPFSDSILSNGKFSIKFIKNNNKYEAHYDINSNAELSLNNNLIKSDFLLNDYILKFKNFSHNDDIKKSSLEYNIKNDEFNFNINDTINQKIYDTIKFAFNLNQELQFPKNIGIKLNITKKNKKYGYTGKFSFNDDDLILTINDQTYKFEKIKGSLSFSNNSISNSNLNIKKFQKDGITLIDNSIQLNNSKNIYNIKIKNPIAEGTITYNSLKDDLSINIADINYTLNKEDTIKIINENETQINEIKKIELPKKLSLILTNFKIDNQLIGNVEFISNKNKNTYDILTKIKEDTYSTEIFSVLNSQNNLDSNFSLSIKNPEKFSNNYNLKKIIKNTQLNIKGKLSTNLNEYSYSNILKNLNGNFELESKDGEFIEVKTGAGVLLNIFNFRSIPDFVTLDFKNIFSNKLTYDKIYGKYTINNGTINIDNTDIKSKISDVSISGDINLNTEQLNLNMKVVPKLTNSILFTTISLATGFNPITMIGSSLIEKVIPMPNVIKYNYYITGSISNPEIKK